MNRTTTPAKPLTMWIIHFAFIMAVPIYAVVASVIQPGVSPAGAPLAARTPWLPWALVFLSVVQIPLGYFLPEIMTRSRQQAAEKSSRDYLALCQLKMILSDAFFEAIAVYGLVGVIAFGMALQVAYALMGLSLVLLLTNIPRIAGWIDEYRQREGRWNSRGC